MATGERELLYPQNEGSITEAELFDYWRSLGLADFEARALTVYQLTGGNLFGIGVTLDWIPAAKRAKC